MSESKWTPEPWEWDGSNRIIVGEGEGLRVAGVTLSIPNTDETCANAERIVACVNACAGIADPKAVADLVEAVRARVLSDGAVYAGACDQGCDCSACRLRAALAKLEGESR